MKKCPACEKGNLEKKTVPYDVYGIELGKFPAKVCNICNEVWFSEETSKMIEDLEKKKGLFGLSRHSKISFSGNSLIIRVPNALAKFMNLKKEEPVIIYPENKKKLIIEI
ncbi:MAG: YgiT-type zinc finger protein [Candidatus Woesearchaeota archaeon]